MISINFNPSVLKTQNSLNIATSALNKSLLRMSTGYRINSASDDAAGLFMASSLYSQISGLKQAQNNVSMGMSYLGIAEGALGNMTNILNRLRDLAVQGSNSTYDSTARTAMQNEADALIAELSRVKDSATFNGVKVFGENVVETTSGIPSVDTVPAGYTGIYTVDDLKNINGSSDKFILMNDLDLSGEDWTSIGSFSGVLDGNGHVIKNLTSTHGGLINNYHGGEVKNLGLENVDIKGDVYIGGLVNKALFTKISNCYVTGNIKGTSNGAMVGGLAGEHKDAIIESCYTDCKINSSYAAAGIVGIIERMEIKNCYSKGSISAEYNVGGIVGSVGTAGAYIKQSYSTAQVKGTRNIGGIVGDPSNARLTDCVYNQDTVQNPTSVYTGEKGLSTNALANKANFENWDNNIWDFSTKAPTLKNMASSTQSNNVRLQIGSNSEEATNAIYLDTALNINFHEFNFTSAENCSAVIEKIDLMLNKINEKNSLIGATQNRLESVADSQAIQLENYTSAFSTIMDADIAEESANYVKSQILQQTTSSLLSQAQSIQASLILNIIGSLG